MDRVGAGASLGMSLHMVVWYTATTMKRSMRRGGEYVSTPVSWAGSFWSLGLFLGAVMSLAAGCASDHQRTYELETAQDAYMQAVRWGDWTAVRALHRNADAQEAERIHEQGRSVRFSSYQVLDAGVNLDKGTAWQLVELRYYRVDSNVERRVVDTQNWVYDESRRGWFVDTSFPKLD